MDSVYTSLHYHEKEDQLLEAIEHGNIDKVVQLLTSGIGINTVLHSRTRHESATILATAAYEGHVDIMRYLIGCNALIHYQDPLLWRNALHWACMGGRIEAVQLLLTHGAKDVNCLDRDNVTPIIRASINGSYQIVRMLLDHGADVKLCDRLHSSPLHYSTFHGRRAVTRLLIQSGCIPNDPTIFGQGTPLANLVYHEDVENVRLLLASGYSLERDAWVPQYSRDTEVGVMLSNEYHNPSTLGKLCRTTIRNHIAGVRLQNKIESLPLPQKLIDYLKLNIL